MGIVPSTTEVYRRSAMVQNYANKHANLIEYHCKRNVVSVEAGSRSSFR